MPIDIEGYTRLTAKDLHPEGIQNLTEAIVARAADDWRRAVAAQKRGNALNEYRRSRKEVEQFFFVGLVLHINRVRRPIHIEKAKAGGGH